MIRESEAGVSNVRDVQWTTGGEPGVVHQKLIDMGGFSEVHQVHLLDLINLILDAQNGARRGKESQILDRMPLLIYTRIGFCKKVGSSIRCGNSTGHHERSACNR